MSKTKVDIISGFLGAGKTTFIKKLLKEAINNEKTILIENEFGEIGIDGGFLKDAGIEIKEMNSGCICCSIVGDFSKSLEEILTKYSPDRVIIEPSGVGKLSDVLKAVYDVEEELEVHSNTAVTIVDVNKCKMYIKNFGEFFNDQIKNATTIVCSRTDIAKKEKIDEAVSLIRQINSSANIITTPISELSGSKLLDILESKFDLEKELMEEVKHHHEHSCGCEEHGHHHEHNCGCEEHGHHHEHSCGCEEHGHHHEHSCGCEGHEHHHEHSCDCEGHSHHHAEDVFTSIGLEQVPAISREKLEIVLDMLAHTKEYGTILRAKGMIPEEGTKEWIYFDLVPGEIEIRKGEADSSGKVCVIGANLSKEEIKEVFGK